MPSAKAGNPWSVKPASSQGPSKRACFAPKSLPEPTASRAGCRERGRAAPCSPFRKSRGRSRRPSCASRLVGVFHATTHGLRLGSLAGGSANQPLPDDSCGTPLVEARATELQALFGAETVPRQRHARGGMIQSSPWRAWIVRLVRETTARNHPGDRLRIGRKTGGWRLAAGLSSDSFLWSDALRVRSGSTQSKQGRI